MKFIPQNSPGLLGIIQSSGCFFRSMGILAEDVSGKYLTEGELNEVWKKAQESGCICNTRLWDKCPVKPYEAWSKVCTTCPAKSSCRFNEMIQPAAVGNLFLAKLGVADKKFVEVGTIQPGKEPQFYEWAKGKYRENLYYIRKIRQSGPQGVHFVALHRNSVVDPHHPAIESLGELYTIIYSLQG